MACRGRKESLTERKRSIQREGGPCRRTALQVIRLSHALHVKCKVRCTKVISMIKLCSICRYQLDHSGCYPTWGLNRPHSQVSLQDADDGKPSRGDWSSI